MSSNVGYTYVGYEMAKLSNVRTVCMYLCTTCDIQLVYAIKYCTCVHGSNTCTYCKVKSILISST